MGVREVIGLRADARGGLDDDFAEAIRPHLPSMIRLAARLGPESGRDDVVQDALVRAWRHRDRFDPGRGSFGAWLLTIVANEARRAAGRRANAHRPGPTTIAPARPPAQLEDRLDLADAVRRLPPRQRLAVDCFYYVGLSVAETAAVMNCSEGTVKSTLADARRGLQRALEGDRR